MICWMICWMVCRIDYWMMYWMVYWIDTLLDDLLDDLFGTTLIPIGITLVDIGITLGNLACTIAASACPGSPDKKESEKRDFQNSIFRNFWCQLTQLGTVLINLVPFVFKLVSIWSKLA